MQTLEKGVENTTVRRKRSEKNSEKKSVGKKSKGKIILKTILGIFEDKNEKFEIQIGAWDTEISEIYYTIHDKDPMKDDKVSVAFFETVKEILDVFSENVKEEEIRQEFSKIKIPEQSMEWNYSEKISLFVGRTGDDFDFRIYPR